jgi:anti-sigma factor RsiW
MRCGRLRKSLDTYVLGELASDERRQVEAHAAECAGCARMLAERSELLAALRAVAPPPVPEGFADRVTAAAEARRAVRPRSVPGRPRGGRWAGLVEPRRVAAAAAMAAGVALGAWLGQQTWQAVEVSRGRAEASGAAASPASTLDYFVDFHDDSIAQTYLLLTSARDNGGV